MYRKEWEDTFNWLSPGKLKTEAFCKTCDLKINISSGKLQLVRHQDTKNHVQKSKLCSRQEKITSFVKKSDNSEIATKKADIYISSFIAEHNLPFTVTEHLPKLLSAVCSDSEIAKKIKCSRTKTTAIVKNVIGLTNFENICSILRNVKFSIIIDESTDLGCTKHLVIVARYFHEDRSV